jgi:sortase A
MQSLLQGSPLQQQGERLMKNKLITFALLLAFFAGLSLLLYPTVSDYWNSLHQSGIITDYEAEVASLDDGTYEQALQQANAFNQYLAANQIGSLDLNDQERATYDSLLDVTADHVMSYIEIPTINLTLPIYHGTEDTALQIGIGHIEGSSLPVGGESTHCVLVGHRGLPSAKLFTNLDRLSTGDQFLLHTLNETLTYEVDQILIVEPEDIDDLLIVPGEDYCTLVTCTPYGVNTQRLLVRGHRVENQGKATTIRVTADAVQIEPVVVAPFAAVPIFLLLLLWVLHQGKRRKK